MNTHHMIRAAMAVAVIGCATWALAAVMEAEQSAPARKPDGQQVSSGQAASAPVQQGNNVTHLLQYTMTTYQDKLMAETNDPARTDHILRAVNMGMLSACFPEDRDAWAANLQIETFRAGDKEWAKVAKTPSMVKHLKGVSAEADAFAAAEFSRLWDELLAWMKPLTSEPGFYDLPIQEQNSRRMAYGAQIELKRKTWLLSELHKSMDGTRKLLTAEQRKEFDAIWKNFTDALPGSPRP